MHWAFTKDFKIQHRKKWKEHLVKFENLHRGCSDNIPLRPPIFYLKMEALHL